MPTSCSIFLGAVIGWGVLSPIAKSKGWAPGPVDSMEQGSRGWLLWISIGLLLGDAAVRMLHGGLFIKRFFSNFNNRKSNKNITCNLGDASRQPLIGSASLEHDTIPMPDPTSGCSQSSQLVPNHIIIFFFVISILLCTTCTSIVFYEEIPFYLVPIAIVISFPLCLVVIQSSGETATVPSNSLSKRIPQRKKDYANNIR